MQNIISFNDLLSITENLSFEELTKLSNKITQIQTKRIADNQSLEETLLLEKIRKPLDSTIKKRFNILKDKRLAEILTTHEHQEYLQLIEVIEMDNAEKVKHVGALALLRNRPILELGKELGVFNNG